MASFRLHKLQVSIWLALVSACAAAQVNDNAALCSSPEVILQRYIDAVGGKAVYDIQSRTITAKERTLVLALSITSTSSSGRLRIRLRPEAHLT